MTPAVRQVDYLDQLEQELLAQASVCPTHGVIREGGHCCVCMGASLAEHRRKAGKNRKATT